MKFTKPAANAIFTIDEVPAWPSIELQTDAAGSHAWHWTIAWKSFTKSGTATTATNRWDAATAITNLGGTLTVRAEASGATSTIAVTVKGTNPGRADAEAYLKEQADSAGFEKIIGQESRFKHFTASGEPVKSFDGDDAANAGKTEADLHKRDMGEYSKPPKPGAHWAYFGICYADHLLR